MSLEQLRSARQRTVGTKETMKAVQNRKAKLVFVAEDAEIHVTQPLKALCRQNEVPIIEVASMRELGRTCGIEVGAASAAVIVE